MAPVGYGMLAAFAGAIVLAALVGAVGGAIIGRLNADLALGAIATFGAYVLISALDGHWRLSLIGMLPLTLTFAVASITTHYLEQRMALHPVFVTSAALGSALIVGCLYALPMRFGWWGLADVETVWIGGAALVCLIIFSIRRRMLTTP